MINSLTELKAYKDKMLKGSSRYLGESEQAIVYIGMATCGIAAGAEAVHEAILDEISKRNIRDVTVVPTGCVGKCYAEPLVEIIKPGFAPIYVDNADADTARRAIGVFFARLNNEAIGEQVHVNEGFGNHHKQRCGYAFVGDVGYDYG